MVGDIILVRDKTPVKGHYIMAVIEAVTAGKDDLVWSCKVSYGIPCSTKDVTKYDGRRWVSINHSVQRLSLLLTVEEQERPLTIEAGKVKAVKEEAVEIMKLWKLLSLLLRRILRKLNKKVNVLPWLMIKLF